jgi:hypothetical protein
MPENCTIFCKRMDVEELPRLINSYFPSLTSADETFVLAHGEKGSIKFSVKVFKESGDDFCRMMLGMRAFVKTTVSRVATRRQAALDHLDHSDLAIGVVVEPAFDADQRYHAVVFAIAKALDGVVFDGQNVLDANGEPFANAV